MNTTSYEAPNYAILSIPVTNMSETSTA